MFHHCNVGEYQRHLRLAAPSQRYTAAHTTIHDTRYTDTSAVEKNIYIKFKIQRKTTSTSITRQFMPIYRGIYSVSLRRHRSTFETKHHSSKTNTISQRSVKPPLIAASPSSSSPPPAPQITPQTPSKPSPNQPPTLHPATHPARYYCHRPALDQSHARALHARPPSARIQPTN